MDEGERGTQSYNNSIATIAITMPTAMKNIVRNLTEDLRKPFTETRVKMCHSPVDLYTAEKIHTSMEEIRGFRNEAP